MKVISGSSMLHHDDMTNSRLVRDYNTERVRGYLERNVAAKQVEIAAALNIDISNVNRCIKRLRKEHQKPKKVTSTATVMLELPKNPGNVKAYMQVFAQAQAVMQLAGNEEAVKAIGHMMNVMSRGEIVKLHDPSVTISALVSHIKRKHAPKPKAVPQFKIVVRT